MVNSCCLKKVKIKLTTCILIVEGLDGENIQRLMSCVRKPASLIRIYKSGSTHLPFAKRTFLHSGNKL